MLRWTLILLALVARVCAAQAAQEDYVVTIQDVRAGAMRVERLPDGVVRVDFSYLDNGRGPRMTEEFRVGDAQRPLSYQVQGTSEFGGEIREEFQFGEGRVRWTSPVDRGDEAAAEGSVFVPLESTPAYQGQLLRALLARRDGSAPAGAGATLVAERLVSMQLDGPQEPVAVVLYVITGADTDPWYVWLHDDGSTSLFAIVAPGWYLTPAGFEQVGGQLLARQREAQTDRLRAIRQRTAQALPGLTLIRDVRWFDAPAAVMRGPSDVYLFEGRIGSITAPGAIDAKPRQTIDGRFRTLLPGLWDMHAHMWPEAGLLHLAAGVTSVRDLGNQNDDLLLLKEQIDAGMILGPHITPAGFIEGSSPFSARNGFVVADVEAGLRAVDWYAARGYHQIKLYNSIRPEWVRPLADRAHQRGMKVAGHVPAFLRAEEAVLLGYDELTHINQVMLNFLVKPDQDTRTLLRFTLVGDEARRVDLHSPAARRFLALLRKRGTVVDPTLACFEAMYTQRDGERNPSLGDIADHLPVLWRRNLLKSELSPTNEQAVRYRPSYARMVDLTGALHRAGVTLVAGTDSTPGLMLHRELELYVRAGIPPREVLRIATWNGARIAGAGDIAGSIQRGKAADLVLVDGDPSRDIAELRRASLVIKGAEAYAPAQLFEAIGMSPFVPAATIERAESAD